MRKKTGQAPGQAEYLRLLPDEASALLQRQRPIDQRY
jgi:hypothetical protein